MVVCTVHGLRFILNFSLFCDYIFPYNRMKTITVKLITTKAFLKASVVGDLYCVRFQLSRSMNLSLLNN